jgi:hypothetical protein
MGTQMAQKDNPQMTQTKKLGHRWTQMTQMLCGIAARIRDTP